MRKEVRKGKGKEEYFYSYILVRHTHKAPRHGSHSFTCKLHHACLFLVSVHQMAPPLTEIADIQLQLTTHSSTPKGWNAELAWLDNLLWTAYPHKWSPVSYRSSAGQGSSLAKDRRSTAVPRNQGSRSHSGTVTLGCVAQRSHICIKYGRHICKSVDNCPIHIGFLWRMNRRPMSSYTPLRSLY